MKTLVVIDTHALIHRSWHALPPLTSPDGRIVNAVYGFASIFLKMVRELKPDYIVAAYDLAEPTFREKAFKEYKATRAETPSELVRQFQIVREFLQTIGVPILDAAGFEADDAIGAAVEQAKVQDGDLKIIIVTGDLDTLQLVEDEKVVVYTLRRGITDTVVYDEAAVKTRYGGLEPKQLVDYKGLKGDPSDNIPGVRGIGEKTAIALLREFGSIEGIWQAIEDSRERDKKSALTPKLAERLKNERENAVISRMLGTIRRDAPVAFTLEQGAFSQANLEKASSFFEDLGFRSLLNRLPTRARVSFEDSKMPGSISLPSPAVEDFEISKLSSGEDLAVFLAGQDFFITDGSKCVYKLVASEARKLEPLFLDEKRLIISFGLKPILRKIKIFDVKAKLFDCAVVWWLLHPNISSPDFERVVEQELKPSFHGAPPAVSALLLELYPRLEGRLEAMRLAKLYHEIEAPLIVVLAEMEERGIGIDAKALKDLTLRLQKEVQSLERQIWQAAGEEFRIASPIELRRILFEKLKLDAGSRLRKTPGGILSTQERELAKLEGKHPIINLLLQWREYSKLESTYLKSFDEFINPETGRVHTTFIQTGTVTGRLASASPNLQNIPASLPWGREIRNLFVARDGFSFVSFDYSQLELRIAAHLSGDRSLKEIFEQDGDVHRETAAAVFGVKSGEVDDGLRARAKTLNFGMLYGMGAASFAESTGLSRDEAKAFIEAYFAKFHGLRRYFAELLEQANLQGFVETIFGRRRFLPLNRASGWAEHGRVDRMMINFPIQGSAADIVKLAMVRAQELVRAQGLVSDVHMLLQIHDELLFEIRDAKLKEAILMIKDICENAAGLKVPLRVDVKIGKSWGNLKLRAD